MVLMIFTFNSCTVKKTFLTSAVVPAAQGDVTITRDNNKNYVIKVDVSNLAEVERLQSSKNSYVVWMKTDKGKTENLGQLSSSTGFLSKQLKGSLETVSSYKPARIFITAEDNINAQYPDLVVVLTTDTF